MMMRREHIINHQWYFVHFIDVAKLLCILISTFSYMYIDFYIVLISPISKSFLSMLYLKGWICFAQLLDHELIPNLPAQNNP